MVRRILCCLFIVGVWLTICPAEAAFLLYNTTTLRVYSGGDDPFTIHIPAGYDLFEVPGVLLAEIAWPVPTAPSSCARGKLPWTKLSPGVALPLLYNTDMHVFHCVIPDSANDVWAQVSREIDAALATGNPLTTVLGKLNVAALGVCPPANLTSDCANVRTDMVTLNAVPGGAAAALHGFLISVITLVGEANTFIAAVF